MSKDTPPAKTRVVADPGRTTRARGVSDPTHISMRLPPQLESIFEPVREVGFGGQATLLLCRRIADPHDEVVVKLYNTGARNAETDPREAFRALSREHVVEYVDPYFGQFNGRWWEVLEYMSEGNLRELAGQQGGRLTAEQVDRLIRGACEALDHLHTRDPHIIHRDIKPENLLVRDRDPLHVVLADFGLAVLTEFSHDRHSGSRTDAYAAPEAPWGDVAPPLDWWSLGMTIAELAAGRHPYEEADGRLPNERKLGSLISTRPVPLDAIADPRLLLLLRGLLTKDPDQRWRATEVRQWLAGGSPEVAQEQVVTSAVPTIQPFPFAGTSYTDAAELGTAVLENWDVSARTIAGRDFEILVGWVEENAPALSLKEIAKERARRSASVDATIADVGARLNPRARPVFRGEPVDLASLSDWARRVPQEPALTQLIEQLFVSRALYSYARLEGHQQLGLVESEWQDMCEAATSWFAKVKEAGSMTPEARALILRAAVARVVGKKAK